MNYLQKTNDKIRTEQTNKPNKQTNKQTSKSCQKEKKQKKNKRKTNYARITEMDIL